jgi:hypothetical protein
VRQQHARGSVVHLDGLREDGLAVPEPCAVGALTIDAA